MVKIGYLIVLAGICNGYRLWRRLLMGGSGDLGLRVNALHYQHYNCQRGSSIRRLFRRGTHESTEEDPGGAATVATVTAASETMAEEPDAVPQPQSEQQPDQQQSSAQTPTGTATVARSSSKNAIMLPTSIFHPRGKSRSDSYIPVKEEKQPEASRAYGFGLGRGQSIQRPRDPNLSPRMQPVPGERTASPRNPTRLSTRITIRSDPQEYTKRRDYDLVLPETGSRHHTEELSQAVSASESERSALRASSSWMRFRKQLLSDSQEEDGELRSSKGVLRPKDVRVVSADYTRTPSSSSYSWDSVERALSQPASPSPSRRSLRSSPQHSPTPSRSSTPPTSRQGSEEQLQQPLPLSASSGQFAEAEEALAFVVAKRKRRQALDSSDSFPAY